MTKTLLAATMFLTIATGSVNAQPQVVLGAGIGAPPRTPYNQPAGTTRMLSSDTVYVLTGIYYVDSTASMTIQAGTKILGDSLSQGTLVIRRGATINASGTVNNPIVFAPLDPPGRRNPGDWGGVVVLGKAPVNKTEPVIEGGLIEGSYGGNDANDNSGVIRYVRIEFPGTRYQLNNEVNGLTMGGVGRGTTIDHVQVSYSFDDSYEWFGGTAEAKYLVAYSGTDDEFDSDFGWSGKVQFGFGKRNPQNFDAAGQSNGFESDNDDPPTLSNPRTSGVFSNMTLIGPQADTNSAVSTFFERVALLRRNTRVNIHNSILMGYPFGIEFRNDTTAAGALANYMQIRNVSLQAKTNVLTKASVAITFDPVAWFTTAGWNNTGSTARQPADVVGAGVAAWFNLTNPAPIPVSGQGDASLFTTDYSSAQLSNSFFTSVNYRGAFDPALPMDQQWTAGWTNFDPQNTQYLTSVSTVDNTIPDAFVLDQNYPNPFNPSTVIRFSVPHTAQVTLKVYNMLGQEVATLVNEAMNPGTFETKFDATGLASGVYFYRMTAGSHANVRKLVVMK